MIRILVLALALSQIMYPISVTAKQNLKTAVLLYNHARSTPQKLFKEVLPSKQHKTITRLLKKNKVRKLPMAKEKDGKGVISSNGKTATLEMINPSKKLFKLNGRILVVDPQMPVKSLLKQVNKKLASSKPSQFDFFVSPAHAFLPQLIAFGVIGLAVVGLANSVDGLLAKMNFEQAPKRCEELKNTDINHPRRGALFSPTTTLLAQFINCCTDEECKVSSVCQPGTVQHEAVKCVHDELKKTINNEGRVLSNFEPLSELISSNNLFRQGEAPAGSTETVE